MLKAFSLKLPGQCLVALCILAGTANANAKAVCPRPAKGPQATPGIIPANTRLIENKRYYSPDKSVYLVHQSDGNLVLYKRVRRDAQVALWNARTYRQETRCAVFQGDGNLVVYNMVDNALWNSVADARKRDRTFWDSLPPYGIDSKSYMRQYGTPHLAVQNDNNLVVYDGSGTPLWASGTAAR